MLCRSQKDYKLCKQHSNWETLSSLVMLQTSKSRSGLKDTKWKLWEKYKKYFSILNNVKS